MDQELRSERAIKPTKKKYPYFTVPIVKIRTLRSEDGDGSENVALKVNAH